MIDPRKKGSSVIRYWLQQEPMTISELAEQSGIEEVYVRKIVRRYALQGLVDHAGARLNRATGKYTTSWAWCGKETIEGLMARAAIALRDGIEREEAMKISRGLFAYLESTTANF